MSKAHSRKSLHQPESSMENIIPGIATNGKLPPGQTFGSKNVQVDDDYIEDHLNKMPGWIQHKLVSVNNVNTGIAIEDGQIKFSYPIELSLRNSIRILDGDDILPVEVQDNGANADITFKANVPIGVVKQFDLYYENPEAPPVSDFDAVYQKTPVNANTINLWRFDEGSGTTAADLGSGNKTASFVGGVTWGDDAKFEAGKSANLNGSSGYINIPDALQTYTPTGRIRMWIVPAANISADKRLFFKANADAFADFFDIFISGVDGKLHVHYVNNNGTDRNHTGANRTWLADTAYRICVTWDINFILCYINGQLYLKAAKELLPQNGNFHPLVLGALKYDASAAAQFFHGRIDDVEISDKYCTADEALTDYECRQLIPSKQEDKLSPQKGRLVLSKSGSGWDDGIIAEGTIRKLNNGKYAIFYSGTNAAASDGGIGLATADTMEGPFVKDAGNPIVGVGKLGNRSGNLSYLFDYGIYTYMISVAGYGDRHLYLYRAAKGETNFTDRGKLLDKSAIPPGDSPGIGNVAVLPVLINGVFIMIVESYNAAESLWDMHRFTATNIEGPYTYDRVLSSLQVVAGKSYGGPRLDYFDNKMHMWYHFAGDASVVLGDPTLPTRLVYANSSDGGITWGNIEYVMGIMDKPFGNTDQNADPEVAEPDPGKTYVMGTYMQNSPSYEGQLRVWEFNGTKKQLVSGGLTVQVI